MDTVCTHVLIKFKNLTCLQFHPYSDTYVNPIERVWFRREEIQFFSSNLLELHVNVTFLTDCLYLLDGRFPQLHTFCSYVFHLIIPEPIPVINQVD